MTVKVNFEVHGLRELHKSLTDLPKELVSKGGGPVKTALMSATLPVMRTAQTTIPDRDEIPNKGQLAKAIRRRRMAKLPNGKEGVQVYVRAGRSRDDESGAFYAPWVEFGAKGLPGTRWFTKSLRNNAKSSTEIFKTKLAAAIERIAKKIGNENARAVAAQVKRS